MRALFWVAGFALLVLAAWHFATWDVARQVLILAGAVVWTLVGASLLGGKMRETNTRVDLARVERLQERARKARALYASRHGERETCEREKENPNVWADIASAFEEMPGSRGARS